MLNYKFCKLFIKNVVKCNELENIIAYFCVSESYVWRIKIVGAQTSKN